MIQVATSRPQSNDDLCAAAARELVPALRQRSAATERAGRLPDVTLDDLHSRNLLTMLKPQRFGGQQVRFSTTLNVLMDLARGDASVAWVASVMNANNFVLSSSYAPETIAEVYENPRATITSVINARKFKARRVDGGVYVEEGLWGFNSGVYHSQWDSLFAPLTHPETGAPDIRTILVPTAQLEMLNDWDVMGLRATGSTTVRLRDTFVPDRRISRAVFTAHASSEAQASNEDAKNDPLYRISPAMVGALSLLAVVLGAADGALDVFMEQLPGRRILYTRYDEQGHAAATHLQIAEASAKVDAAKALIHQDIEAIEAASEDGRELTLIERGRIRRDAAYAATLASEAVNILASASGGSFIATSNPMNRVWRDVHAGAQHAALTQATVFEAYGRICCGLNPENPTI